ncbi:hypothetical protein LINGRAHAP2_LOCUS21267 [Linum grandiflorum]
MQNICDRHGIRTVFHSCSVSSFLSWAIDIIWGPMTSHTKHIGTTLEV